MDQNADAGVPITPAVENKQKGGKGLKITTAIACIVAVCGIGFGVYGMIQSSQKDNQISNLEAEKTEDRAATTEIPENKTTTDDGTVATDTTIRAQINESIEFEDKKFVIHDTWREWDCSNNEPYTYGFVSTDEVAKELAQILSNPEATDTIETGGGPYIENDYFYVPKWGVKFKLSDDLTNYGYAVDQTNQGDSYGDYVVGLTALMKKDYLKNPQTQYFHDIFSCSVVTIRKAREI